jgi:hypothetical protein
MRLLMSVTSVLWVAVAATGCSDPISPQLIVGLWEQDGSPPGNSLQIQLALNGAAISGQGSWCGEALSCGSTSTTGLATGDKIHLVTTFDSGLTEIFDGILTSPNSLVGSVRGTAPGGPIQLPHAQSFHRLIYDPPMLQ